MVFEGLERGFPTTNGQQSGFYFYRIYMDTNSKEVRILGQNGGMQRAAGSNSRTSSAMVGGHGAYGTALATMEFLTKNPSGTTSGDLIGRIDMNAGTFSSGGACAGRAVDLTVAGTRSMDYRGNNRHTHL